MTEGPPPFDSWHAPDPEQDDERVGRLQEQTIRDRGWGELFGMEDGEE